MKLSKVTYTYESFIKEFNALNKWLDKTRDNGDEFHRIKKLTKENLNDLHAVLDAGFRNRGPFHNPMLNYWIGDAELTSKPLLGEQKLFNSIVDYLFTYYKLDKTENIVENLHTKAMNDPNNIAANESYYEISQLFSAFGRTSIKDMQKQRLEKLARYAEQHTFKPDMKVLYEAIVFCANMRRMDPTILRVVKKGMIDSNPYAEKGARNVGTPFWKRTSTKIAQGTIEEGVFNLAQLLYEQGLNSKHLTQYKNIPATLFGRNSTKGVKVKLRNTEYKILNFDASARVIYGIPLITNIQIVRLYYSVLQELKKRPFFLPLQGTEKMRKVLPQLAAFDAQLGVFRASTDQSRYDTTLSRQLMICAALTDKLAFGTTNSTISYILLSLIIDAQTPIYYKDRQGGEIKILKTDGGHKSGFQNTLDWGSTMGNIIYTYSALLLDRKWFYATYKKYKEKGLPFAMFVGDDWSVLYKNKSDYLQALEIISNTFGLIGNAKKSAFNVWIVQNGLNTYGKVSYPLARALRSFYYPERDPNPKPPMVIEGTVYSLIYLLWESPHLDYFIKEHVLKSDKYRGGTFYDGKELTFKEFYTLFVQQCQDYAKKSKINPFNPNDPRWKDLLDSNGNIKSEYLEKIFNKILSCK